METKALRTLQQHQLEMFKKVDEICQKHNITYYLTHGSALGAVRHEGFIPWDDDIDISMPWDSYIQFEQIELGEKYFYQSEKTDEHCITRWNKVRINNTTSMDKHLTHIRCHYGICMDIFPIIGVPNSSLKSKIQRIQTLMYTLFSMENYLTNRKPTGNIIFKIAYSIFPKKVKQTIKKTLLNSITKYDMHECNKWAEFLTDDYTNIIFEKELYGKGKTVTFEDMEAVVPAQVEEYLSRHYGNYMELPPEDKRVGHGETIIDFEKSYEHYWN